VIGGLSLLAVIARMEWLVAVLALQLIVGLTLGRRVCLPCLLYFEVLQPRFGEGPIEDARPPRFANVMGAALLSVATLAFLLDAAVVGWVLTGIVAALALLAAVTGLCLGCEMYRLTARLRGISARRVHRIEPDDVEVGSAGGVVEFTHPLCSECRDWQERLALEGRSPVLVDVSKRPELARKYGVAVVPTIVAVHADGTVFERLAP
jgi:Domain of unknown function (DUF4395)